MNIFGNIHTQIKMVQDQLAHLQQNNSGDSNLNAFIELENKLKYWYEFQQDFYMQRAKRTS